MLICFFKRHNLILALKLNSTNRQITLITYPCAKGYNVLTFSVIALIFSGSLLVPNSNATKDSPSSKKQKKKHEQHD